MDQTKKKFRNYSICYNDDLHTMTNYIMDRTGVTNRSQAFKMAVKQYYLSLREDEKLKALK